jgi:hypothetical protein
MDDLFKYLKKNSEAFKFVSYIDLNDKVEKTIALTIDKLHFQDSKKINYLPTNLANIFKVNSNNLHKYLHIGVLKAIDGISNISLFSSIITCLKQTFISQTTSNQTLFIMKFVERLKSESKGSKFVEFGYKRYKWDKTDLYNDLSNGAASGNVVKYLCDYLHINIFVLDLDKDELYFGGGEEYIPYKKTIFLLKYEDDTFEPFCTEQSRIFVANDDLIKHIRENKKYVKCHVLSDKVDAEFNEIEEDLEKYRLLKTKKQPIQEKNTEIHKIQLCEMEVKKDNDSSDESSDESSDDFDEELSELESELEEELEKPCKIYKSENIKSTLKLAELQEIAKELEINIAETKNKKTKAKTKDQLVTEIKKILKKKK